MRSISLPFLLFMLLLLSCETNVKQTPNGFKFRVIKKGYGALPAISDAVIFRSRIVDKHDSVWRETYSRSMPEVSFIGDSSRIISENSLKQMSRMVVDGDSIVANITAKVLYDHILARPIPEGIDPGTPLKFCMKVEQISNAATFFPLTRVWKERYDRKMVRKDSETIDRYLEERNINAERDSSGVRFVITKDRSADKAKSGQVVGINYTGYLLDGRVIETNNQSVAEKAGIYNQSQNYSPIELVIDDSQNMSGWNVAFKLLGKGESGTFYIPSPLAYGESEFVAVLPNTILIYDIEIVDIKNAN